MSTKEIIQMIDQYFDEELTKGSEPVMFTLLAQDAEAREYFKRLNALKSGMINTMEEFPSALDEKILRTVGSMKVNNTPFIINRNTFSVITYSVSVILLILTIFFYTRSEKYEVQFSDLTREVKKQNDRLELIMNALPQVDVSGNYYRTNQIVVRPNS
ncbi:MAG: hypothetical protein C0408_10280 [Odoribacter sp.]|nr:hypothetical protein [Odoribacter sp.]